MNIRIARDGKEIARVEDAEMLRHAVNGNMARLDDHAFEEGSEEWVTVRQLLDDADLGGELTIAENQEIDASLEKSSDPLLIGICFFKDFYRRIGPAGFEGVPSLIPSQLPPLRMIQRRSRLQLETSQRMKTRGV
ncbi:hypothetical protein OAL92_00695 [bacterium]|nr:hypothetical protein [bacterium]